MKNRDAKASQSKTIPAPKPDDGRKKTGKRTTPAKGQAVVQTAAQLCSKKCLPCEGGVPKLTRDEAERQIEQLAGWELTHKHERIRKQWVVKNYMAAMAFLNHIACLAEVDAHHPDVHIERYRNVTVEIYTHAIGGLSENDFILAAKIDTLPVSLKL